MRSRSRAGRPAACPGASSRSIPDNLRSRKPVAMQADGAARSEFERAAPQETFRAPPDRRPARAARHKSGFLINQTRELTCLPVLRYSSGHRKGRLKILSVPFVLDGLGNARNCIVSSNGVHVSTSNEACKSCRSIIYGGSRAPSGSPRPVRRHSGAPRSGAPGIHDHHSLERATFMPIPDICGYRCRAPSLRSGPGMTRFQSMIPTD
jgi:hypothetical protein